VDAGKLRVLPPLCILYVDISAYAEKSAKLVLIKKNKKLLSWKLPNSLYFLPSVSSMLISAPKKVNPRN
jgi:hypothetical protein